MAFLRRLLALLTSASCLSAADGEAPEWQALTLPKAGEMRLRHTRPVDAAAPATLASAEATAATLMEWTRTNAWDPVRVEVDDSHPLVRHLKAAPLLQFSSSDKTLPIIWLSLEPGQNRALLEDRQTHELAVFALPPGKTLDLGWLGR